MLNTKRQVMERERDKCRRINLEFLILEAGSAAKLARAAGTNASYLSQVRRGTHAPSGKPRIVGDALAEKLEAAMGKSPGWMDMPHETDSDSEPNTRAVTQFDIGYPVLSWRQAVDWTGQETSPTPRLKRLPCPISCSAATFVLEVHGISMLPKFENGDLIFVDPEITPAHGQFVIVRLNNDDEAIFKQLVVEEGRQYLRALNPEWPNRIVEVSGPATICGVVVFKGAVV